MGNNAEVEEEEVTEEEVKSNEDESAEDTETKDSEDDGQEESGDDSEEGKGTQPDASDVPNWVHGRFNKYRGQLNKADSKLEIVEAANKLLRDENTLKDLALEQAKAAQQTQPAFKPNPDNFDGGVDDPGFIKAQDDYIDKRIDDKVGKQVAEATRHTTTTIDQTSRDNAIQRDQEAHVQKAAKLNIKDYDKAEDRTIELLGLDNFNYLIGTVDESPQLVNYLGKKANESVAMEIAEVAKTNPAKAGIIIGGILSKLKAGPGKSKTLPLPDEEVEGGVRPKSKKRGPPGAKFE